MVRHSRGRLSRKRSSQGCRSLDNFSRIRAAQRELIGNAPLVYVKGSNSEFASVLRTNRKGSAMKRFLTGFLIAVFMLAPVMAEQVPFVTPPSDRNPSESAVGTLANIMATIQPRHIKLWFIEGKELGLAQL
jgi:hypothetical protein